MTTQRRPADGPGLPWHVTDDLARRYADGAAPETDAWSLEKHVESCAGCAGRVSAAVRAGTAGPVLAAVRADLLASIGAAAGARAGARPPLAGDTGGRPAPGGIRPTPAPADPAPSTPTSPGRWAGLRWPVGPAVRGAARRRPAHDDIGPTPTQATPSPSTPTRTGRWTGLRGAVGPAVRGAARRRPAHGTTGPTPTQATPSPSTPTRTGRWARLWWAVGPAVRGSWAVAVLLVVGGALALAHGAGVRGAGGLLLALSPVLPLAGVAVSYGRHADPMHEITAATPSGGLRLLLTRTAAVLVVCVPLLTAGGALLPPVAGLPGAAAWLLPGLALTLATLALGSFVGCRAAAATLGGGWLLAVTGPLLGPVDTAAPAAALAPYFSGPAAQGGWAGAALACAALLAVRRRSFDHLEPR
ncbi:zf-HC2 domain-containing protein [Streptomyces sp. NPDC004330]|uniref:zf-HC2 domain-containing protein n=1 Tax=Streptomyces sp. NPDC004330 TaxID=3364700 RepID=UPI0036853708